MKTGFFYAYAWPQGSTYVAPLGWWPRLFLCTQLVRQIDDSWYFFYDENMNPVGKKWVLRSEVSGLLCKRS